MKVILHIGANKTGTTALQRYFDRNRKELLRRGILYPQTGLQGGAHYLLSTWLGFSHGGPALDGESLERERKKFRAEIEQSRASLTIVSSEFFMLKRPMDRLRFFFEGLDLQVVVVLRRHDRWWPSLWAQAIKTVENPSWNRSFEGYLDFQRRKQGQFFDYGALIKTWDDICDGNVQAVPYESAQMSDGIVPAFLAASGLSDLATDLRVDAKKDNVSQRVDVLSLVDFLQRTRRTPPERKRALVARALSCEGVGPNIGAFLSGSLRRRLILENADQYEFLDRRFALPGQSHFFCEPIPEDDGKEGPHPLPPIPAIELLVNEVMASGGR